ncbi:MAG: phosphate-starvation-inducible PsiE family protein [Methanomicrobium sp.]|nr:phosphate-starvation-inducible PsiE family protein [Methanomicrobium sp.]
MEESKIVVREVKRAQSILIKTITNIQLAIYLFLMLILTCVVFYTLYAYIIYLYNIFIVTTVFEMDQILAAISFFLIVLIGLELMDTVKSFLVTHKVNVNIFITLALIAVCRKLIVIDLAEADDLDLLGLGIIIIALASGYYLFKKADLCLPGDFGSESEKDMKKDKTTPAETATEGKTSS